MFLERRKHSDTIVQQSSSSPRPRTQGSSEYGVLGVQYVMQQLCRELRNEFVREQKVNRLASEGVGSRDMALFAFAYVIIIKPCGIITVGPSRDQMMPPPPPNGIFLFVPTVLRLYVQYSVWMDTK